MVVNASSRASDSLVSSVARTKAGSNWAVCAAATPKSRSCGSQCCATCTAALPSQVAASRRLMPKWGAELNRLWAEQICEPSADTFTFMANRPAKVGSGVMSKALDKRQPVPSCSSRGCGGGRRGCPPGRCRPCAATVRAGLAAGADCSRSDQLFWWILFSLLV